MTGLGPVIHAFCAALLQDVDARDKRGHDEERDFSDLPRQVP